LQNDRKVESNVRRRQNKSLVGWIIKRDRKSETKKEKKEEKKGGKELKKYGEKKDKRNRQIETITKKETSAFLKSTLILC
jgi:hypothetical protein